MPHQSVDPIANSACQYTNAAKSGQLKFFLRPQPEINFVATKDAIAKIEEVFE